MDRLGWRLERQQRGRGVYFVLATGRCELRDTVAIGYVQRAEAERLRVGMGRLVECFGGDVVIDMLADESSTKERVAKLHQMLAIADRPADPAWYAGRVEPTKMSLAAYVETWYRPERERARPKLWKRERGLWMLYLLPGLGDVPLGDLDKVRFETFLREVRGKRVQNLSGSTRRLVRAAYVACLQFAEKRGHVDEVHRFFPIEGSSRRALATPEPLDDAELVALLAHAGSPMHRALFAFAFDEGARPTEVVSVDWKDVVFAVTAKRPHGTVRIRGTKNAKADRVVPLFPLARRHLEAWWIAQGQPTEGPVFVWKGRRYRGDSTFRTALIGAAKRAGIEGRRIFPYLTRHSMVTSARAAGATREDVAAIAGHTDPKMVDAVYDHGAAAERVDVGKFPCR